MKILMISRVPNSRTGGAARIMYHLSEEMTRRGHQMDLLFQEDVPDLLGWCGLTGVSFPFSLLIPFWRLSRTRGPYDIVNLHTLAGVTYVWLRSTFRRLPRAAIMSYGADELRWEVEKEEDRLGLRPLPWMSKLLYEPLVIRGVRYATRHADHVITAARTEKDFFIQAYGMDPSTISVISNGVSQEFFIDRKYNPAPRSLLFLGGWEWRKGIRYLAESFCQLAGRYPDLTLSLVGTGEGESVIKPAFPAKFHPRIQVVPRVPPEGLPGVYSAHDIFVFPSLFESMSLVVPEAMASGLPVITTRTCGMQDIVEDGVTGLLVPTRDAGAVAKAVEGLMSHPELCERLGRAAQSKAREITWDRIAEQTLQVYERLLPTTHTTR